MTETTRPTSVRVIADHTPGVHRTDSDDLWLVAADHRPDRQRPGVPASPATPPTARPAGRPSDLARMVGLAGNRSKLWLSLERLHRFHVATFVSTDTLTIRLWLPALTDRQLARLPESMAAAYRPRRRTHRLTPTDCRAPAAGSRPAARAGRHAGRCRPAGGCGGCVAAPGRSSPSFLGAKPFGLTGRSSSTPPCKGEPPSRVSERKETVMNTVTVSGWLQADPVTEHVGDLAVCELRLAVERPGPRPADRRRDA